MSEIADLIAEINVLDDDTPTFERDRSAVIRALELMTLPLPDDLVEYLDNFVPTYPYGRMVEFHDAEYMVSNHLETEIGIDTQGQNILFLAQSGDGSQFGYDLATGAIIHNEVWGDDNEETVELAEETWNSLAEFLRSYRDELAEVVAEEAEYRASVAQSAPDEPRPSGGSWLSRFRRGRYNRGS